MRTVRVSEVRKCTWVKNPISGHEWREWGPVTGWEVYGPLGLISTHKSEEAANKAANDWREYLLSCPIDYGRSE